MLMKLTPNFELTDLSDLIVLGEPVVVEEIEHEGLVERFGVGQVLKLESLKNQFYRTNKIYRIYRKNTVVFLR